MQRILIASCALVSALSLAAQSPLTTTFANNNGGAAGGAVYFDLNAAIPLTITGIDINLSTAAATAGSIDIYTCAATYLGNEANPTAWTMIGTGTVTSNGAGTASTLTLAAPFNIASGPAGYAYVGVGHSFAYTNGNGTNQTYSTTELQLDAGAAANVAFAGVPFTPRVVNTSISYQAAGSGFATKTLFGDGCYNDPRMVHEFFPENTPIDLVNTQQSLFYTPGATGGNYLIIPNAGGPYDGATAAANGVDLVLGGYTSSSSASWDDATVTMVLPIAQFPTGFPYPAAGGGGSVTEISINSNGRIYLGNTTDASFATNGSNYALIAPFQGTTGAGLPVLSPFNVDLDPTTGGSIWYEALSPSGGVRITWDNILNWQDPAGPPALPNQIQLELLPNGQVSFAYGANLGNGGSAANEGLVGFSAGGGEAVSPEVDWSTLVAFITGDGSTPLTNDADARPVIGTTINMTVGNIPPGSPLAAQIYALGVINPGIDLTGFGLPGCFQYANFDAVKLFIGPGSSATDMFPIVNDPGLAGVVIGCQGAAYNPAVINNLAGANTSNGIEFTLDIN